MEMQKIKRGATEFNVKLTTRKRKKPKISLNSFGLSI
jgi:hypothetical protein